MRNKQSKLPVKYTKGFLSQLDARMGLAKELYAAYDEITEDLGGSDNLSHIKLVLVERFVWLSAILRGIEKQIAEGNKEEAGELLGRWIQGLNSLCGLSKCLGLKRETRKLDLKSYVDGIKR